MTRDRFYSIRSMLKVIDDNNVSEVQKQADRLWKIRPLLDKIRTTCRTLRDESNVDDPKCVDEQIIPFTGKAQIRQHVKGKPHPTGLKMYVLSTPEGLALDFEIYQGKGTYASTEKSYPQVGVAGLSVLQLTEKLGAGSSIKIDRYFTTMPLMDALLSLGITASGPIMKNRLPKGHNLPDDKLMKERGSIASVVREDGKVALTKWKDNQAIVLVSTEFGPDPQGNCTRYSVKQKKHISIPCPKVVKEYNANMGGVDLMDRMIGCYRIRARTRWTVRTIMHMCDFSIVNSWIEYRRIQQTLDETPQGLYAFRMQVAEMLIDSEQPTSDSESDEEGPPLAASVPSVKRRHMAAKHLPMMQDLKNAQRCRYKGCNKKSTIKCVQCEVFLCVKKNADCFYLFHTE